MSLLPLRVRLAIVAMIDVAMNARDRPVTAKELGIRLETTPRQFEEALQALVRNGILQGNRGAGGGYRLGRPARQITVHHLLRALERPDRTNGIQSRSQILSEMFMPALAHTDDALSFALEKITLEELVRVVEQRLTRART